VGKIADALSRQGGMLRGKPSLESRSLNR
jgi:hypothetical protein